MSYILGLDIGGANIKACRFCSLGTRSASVYHEVWRDPWGIKDVLEEIKTELREGEPEAVALTMTAELCDVFDSKAQGVLCVLSQVEEAFGGVLIHVWTIDGKFLPVGETRESPLKAAASNWLAGAQMLASCLAARQEQTILIDIGSTTTDILPIAPGKVLAAGRTDIQRLAAGELVYTGAQRTTLNSIVDNVYLDGALCRVANEHFAITADVYRYLGLITEDEYTVPTPDGAGRAPKDCAKRIARLVAGEPEEIGHEKIRLLAEYIMEKQLQQIMDGIWQVASRNGICAEELVITGEGAFLAELAARRLNRKTLRWHELVPGAGPEPAMASFAVAWLLHHWGKDRLI